MSDYVKDVKDTSVDSGFQKEYTLEFRAEERGMERGLDEGFDKGVSKTKREVAEKMLRENESIDKIIEYSGLSEKEIEDIKKTMK